MGDKRKKNLLIIVPSLRLGGQERVAVNTAEIMGQRYAVTIAVFDGRDAAYTAPCEVVDLNIPATPSKIGKVLHVIRRVLALRRLKKSRGIDISFSAGPTANLVNALSRTGEQVVTRLSSYRDITRSAICRLTFRLTDAIICCAMETKTHLTDTYPQYAGKAHYVPNPYQVDELLRQGECPVEDYTFTPHTIAACGRLNYWKNFPRAIRALGLVREKFPDAALLIIGEGELRDRLTELIAHHRLTDCVTLIGHRQNPFSYLEKSALYVHTTYFDGFPNALVEAMCFLPVIAADCKSGPREILSDGPMDAVCERVEEADYGILVRPASDEAWHDDVTEDDRILAEAIIRVFSDEEFARSLKERAKARSAMYSFDAYYERLEQIFS